MDDPGPVQLNGAACLSIAAAATPWIVHINEWLQLIAAVVAIASGIIAMLHFFRKKK